MTGIRQMLGNAAICHEVEAMGAQEPSELLKEWYAVTFIEATASSTNHAIGDDIDLDVAAVVTETDEPLARSLTIGCDEGDIMTYTGLIETSMTNPYGRYVGMTMASGRAIDLEEIRKDFGPADVDDIHNLMKDVFAAAVDGEPVTPGNLRDIFQKQYQQGLGDMVERYAERQLERVAAFQEHLRAIGDTALYAPDVHHLHMVRDKIRQASA